MRTTLTLEPDVVLQLKKKMADEKLTFKDAVNRTLRAGLEAPAAGKRAKFKVIPHSFGFRARIDLDMPTHCGILRHPIFPADATGIVRSWLRLPGEAHAEILFGLLEKLGSAGNLTTDAHLAALAIEY